MSATFPHSLELLLHAVAEACVEEITAARREVVMVRAATSVERRELEEVLELRTRDLSAVRRQNAELERELETAKAAKVSTSLPKRLPLGESVHPTTNEGAKPATASPSLPLSPPRIAVEKGAAAPPAFVRPPVEDLTDERCGSYVCEGRSGQHRYDGRAIWNFRCEHCRKLKQWASTDLKRFRKQGVTCPCTKKDANAQRPRRGRPPRHDYAPQTDGVQSEALEELSEIGGGDDLDGLMSRAMAEAEGDGRIRSLAARAMRPTRPSDLEDEESGDDGDKDAQIAVQIGDDDEDEEDAEELDFG